MKGRDKAFIAQQAACDIRRRALTLESACDVAVALDGDPAALSSIEKCIKDVMEPLRKLSKTFAVE